MFIFHRRILSLPASTGSLSFLGLRKGTPTYFLFPHFLIIAPSESFQSDVQEARSRGSGGQYKGKGEEARVAAKEVKIRIAVEIGGQ
jgi:hypothetical protein